MKACLYCGRPAHLWGGESCDVCDRDSNGINDKDELIGSGAVVVPSIFESQQKGFLVSPIIEKSKKVPYSHPMTQELLLRILLIFQRRLEVNR
jgi:hypothetical protein